MANKPKFEAPQGNPYGSLIQSTDQQPAQKKEYYRVNIHFPLIFKDYLQEMAWRNRTNITQYLTRLIEADMEAHPEWRDSLDELNR